jgi:uncharacterized membrane protein YkoI
MPARLVLPCRLVVTPASRKEGSHMRKTFLVPFVLGAGVLLMSREGAQAKERQVTMESLPPAVRKTVTEQSRGATVRGVSTETEHGQTLYEVELTVNGHTRDVLIAADGSVAEVEEEIAMPLLPAPVRVTLEQEAGSGKILKVEAVAKGGKLAYYEARVQKAGKKSEVTVGPDGKLIHEKK